MVLDKGYLVLKDFIPEYLLNNYTVDINELASIMDAENVFKTNSGKIKQIQNLHKESWYQPLFKHITTKLNLDAEVLNIQYFIKHPNYKITSPHQDGAYFDNIDDDILTFWIPLHSVNEETSTMFYVDWDGKREIIKHDAIGTNVRTRTGKTGLSQYTTIYPLEAFKPIILDRGDCVVHNQFAVHYSNENKTDMPRVAITCIIKLKK